MPSGRRGAPGAGFRCSGFCSGWEDGRSEVAGAGPSGEREEAEVARGVRELAVGTAGSRAGGERLGLMQSAQSIGAGF